MARWIRERLEEIEVATTLNEVSHVPPARLHRLSGDKKAFFAVDVSKNWRMVLEGYDKDDHRCVEEYAIITVVIVGIEEYH